MGWSDAGQVKMEREDCFVDASFKTYISELPT